MRTIIVIILAFLAGYMVREYFGPSALPWLTRATHSITTQNQTESSAKGNVEIVYENGKFTPSEVSVPTSRYLTVINKSESLMWLTSDHPLFNTVRGYGRSELVRVRMDSVGTYTIENKLNVKAKAVVKVEP